MSKAALWTVAFLALLVPALADEDVYLGASLDWNSRYLWRGMPAGEGAVLQPSFWTHIFGTNLMIWANAPLVDGSGPNGFDEVNIFLQGTSPRRPLVVVPGLNVYTYPRAPDAERWTAEVALTFYLPLGSVWLYWENDVDVVLYPGAYYAEFGLQVGGDVADNLNLDLSLAQGYATEDFNGAYLGVPKSGLTFLTAHAELEWRLADFLSLAPHLEVVFALDPDLRKETGAGVRFNFGLTLTLGRE